MKSTAPLKNGKFKYYDNGWNGNQYVKTANVFNKPVMKGLAKAGFVAGLVLNGKEIYDGYKADGGKFGKNVTKQTAGAVGGMGGATGGAIVGAQIGAAIGSMIPGLGTAIGGAIGGVVGAIGGSWGGEAVSEWTVDKVWWGD